MPTVAPNRIVFSVYPSTPPAVMIRVEAPDGGAFTQATVSAIQFELWDVRSGAAVVERALTVADVVFDTAQVNSYWTDRGGDADGYNFRYLIPYDDLESEDVVLVMRFLFAMSSGQKFPVIGQITVRKLLAAMESS